MSAQKDKEKLHTIGELSAEFDLTPRSLRFYEDEGLLKPKREGTKRLYGYRDYARLKLICRGKRLGFSIADIKEFLSLYSVEGQHEVQARYFVEIADKRIDSLEQQLQDVQQTLSELKTIRAEIIDHLSRVS